MRNRRSLTPMLTTVAVLAFFYLPIVVLIVESFNAARYGGSWKGFTFHWYSQLWRNREIGNALVNTLVVGLVSTLVSTIIGTIGAFAIHRYGSSRLQKFHTSMVWLPLMIPEILMGMSLLIFFSSLSPLGVTLGRTTMIIAHVTFCISYVIMVVRARLQDFDNALLEAAQDLGATPWQTTWKVLVPVILPGIAAGALLAFTLSLDDFVISFFVNGKGMTTLPIQVQGMLKRSPMGIINALSTLMILVTFILLIATEVLTGDLFAKGNSKSRKG